MCEVSTRLCFYYKVHFIGVFLQNILQSFEICTKWDTLRAPSASLSVLLLFTPHLFFLFCQYRSSSFAFSFFLPSLSPLKGLKNLLLLQATQVEWWLFCRPRCLLCKIGVGGCYWSAVCEGWGRGGYNTRAYLVFFKMVLQWDIQIKQNACKT